MMQRLANKLLAILASRTFFTFTVLFLVFQALWLALSFRYPMLWDEYYHFGLIKFYGHHLNPIISQQPTSLDMYGNVVRSPKYLYHYAMSFPYRLIVVITANQVAQIIFLRVLNIAMFAGGLVAFRQAMLRLTHSRAMVHFVLLVIVLLPLSSLLAAQINYDNMEFLLSGLVFYWAFRCMQSRTIEIKWLLLVIGGGLLASVVKYTFLPILFAIMLVISVQLWRRHGRQLFSLTTDSFKQLRPPLAAGLVLLMLVGVGLSAERFGINALKYHSIDPKCSKVLSVQRCLQFSPFEQEYTLANAKVTQGYRPNHDLFLYTFDDWGKQIYQQYFSSGTQIASGKFEVYNGLRIPSVTMWFAGGLGVVCFILAAPRLLRRPELMASLLAMGALAAALFIVDYAQYLETGYPLAIQGRYLLPVVPLGMLLGLLAIDRIVPSAQLKRVLAGLTLLGLFWGGGLATHIVLSNSTWYWQNTTVIRVNQDMRTILTPITI